MFELTIDFFPQHRALFGIDFYRYKALVQDSETGEANPRIITESRLGVAIITIQLTHYGKPLEEEWGK